MCLIEVVVWFERGKNHDLTSVSAMHVHHAGVHDKRHTLPGRTESIPSVLHNHWLHGVEASESTFLKLEEVLAVALGPFRVNAKLGVSGILLN
jgi:hypothetical protein